MLKLQSPLATSVIAGSFGAATPDGPRLTISHRMLGSLWQIAGWRDFAPTVEPVLTKLGFDGPGDYRAAAVSQQARCYRVGPDRVWLRDVDPDAVEAAIGLAPKGRLALLDLSHSRIAIGLSGSVATALLVRVSSLDFSLSEFPVGGFAQTGIHQVSVLIHRVTDDGFELLVPVTWVVSLWDWLCVNAEPLGYRVEVDWT